ncbi:MAG: GTPase Era [Firmicutes bacterium]|nr:GTPase Era [Bacillota bacterium]
MADFKSGFAAIIGRPNVGKSTLLNSLLEQKLMIVSSKPQTTRNTIRAVLTRPDGQIIFIDTPGIHRPKHKLGEYMVKTARSTFQEVDVICMMVDITQWRTADDYVAAELTGIDTPIFLIANKSDLITVSEQEKFLRQVRDKHNFFAETIAISAQYGTNLDKLTDTLIEYLPPGPKYYPDDWVTDYPERFIIAEFIREQILHLTEEEIPHSVAVAVDEVKEQADKGIVKIRATIYVERDSQKGIVIGKRGSMLKKIGSAARQQIEVLLGSQVFLDLWVKVKKNWRNKPGSLSEFGYE